MPSPPRCLSASCLASNPAAHLVRVPGTPPRPARIPPLPFAYRYIPVCSLARSFGLSLPCCYDAAILVVWSLVILPGLRIEPGCSPQRSHLGFPSLFHASRLCVCPITVLVCTPRPTTMYTFPACDQMR
ncbi:hypothetical protein AG1IA_06958 [Rhizoctonia solani AG-1 IA]|uniref:Uncharacterized protein n=1 Tax=Thanatephorus cucumeris (strain AG1-IA) TaxID=983506 RepID=L8WLF7_THACA|nr:hypothetical protein AG1IA_06958 [Rhizoctonia solani AG-1 IA]